MRWRPPAARRRRDGRRQEELIRPRPATPALPPAPSRPSGGCSFRALTRHPAVAEPDGAIENTERASALLGFLQNPRRCSAGLDVEEDISGRRRSGLLQRTCVGRASREPRGRLPISMCLHLYHFPCDPSTVVWNLHLVVSGASAKRPPRRTHVAAKASCQRRANPRTMPASHGHCSADQAESCAPTDEPDCGSGQIIDPVSGLTSLFESSKCCESTPCVRLRHPRASAFSRLARGAGASCLPGFAEAESSDQRWLKIFFGAIDYCAAGLKLARHKQAIYPC